MTFVWLGGTPPPRSVRRSRQTPGPQPVTRTTETTAIDAQKSSDRSPPLDRSALLYAQAEEQMAQRRQSVVIVAQIMTENVTTVAQDATIRQAWRLMKKHGFRHLPVVAEEGRLVGIVSDRDILAALPPENESDRRNLAADGPLEPLINANVLAAERETTIREAAKEMLDHDVRCLPIIDATQQLVGILTSTDILHTVVNHAPLDLWI